MSTLKTNNIEQVGNTELPLNLLPVTASAWASFSGVTNILNGSHNISSVTDNATGAYTFNLALPLNNDDFSVVSSSNFLTFSNVNVLSNSSVQLRLSTLTGAGADNVGFIAIFGGQS